MRPSPSSFVLPPRRLSWLALLPLLLAAPAPAARGGEAIAVEARPVPLDPAYPRRTRLDGLRWRGGLHLVSRDPRLGGLSALRWDAGVLVAASDDGDGVALRPRERNGRLVGIASARLRRFAGADGRPLPAVKSRGDIEAVELVPQPGCARCPAAAAIVSLENDALILRYRLADHLPVGAGVPVPGGEAWRAAQIDTNGGVEAQAAGGRFRLMLSEELRAADGGASGWLIVDGVEQPLSLPLTGGFVPVDLVLVDPAAPRFLLLQRDYRKGQGTWTRLSRFALRQAADGRWQAGPVETLATFGPPFTADNMEGLALRRAGGRTFLYMVSDDNKSRTQRTLLMKWEVAR